MVKTTWRCGTGASTFSWSHSAQRICRFFSHEGQKLLPRQENGHIRRLSARPISSTLPHPLPSSLAEVISSWMCAVSTICWSWISLPRIRPST
jgi:hypothetical protein